MKVDRFITGKFDISIASSDIACIRRDVLFIRATSGDDIITVALSDVDELIECLNKAKEES